MVRRRLAVLALVIASAALAACASPTAPTSNICQTSAGSGVCLAR
jgi:hypothetical protein